MPKVLLVCPGNALYAISEPVLRRGLSESYKKRCSHHHHHLSEGPGSANDACNRSCGVVGILGLTKGLGMRGGFVCSLGWDD